MTKTSGIRINILSMNLEDLKKIRGQFMSQLLSVYQQSKQSSSINSENLEENQQQLRKMIVNIDFRIHALENMQSSNNSSPR